MSVEILLKNLILCQYQLFQHEEPLSWVERHALSVRVHQFIQAAWTQVLHVVPDLGPRSVTDLRLGWEEEQFRIHVTLGEGWPHSYITIMEHRWGRAEEEDGPDPVHLYSWEEVKARVLAAAKET